MRDENTAWNELNTPFPRSFLSNTQRELCDMRYENTAWNELNTPLPRSFLSNTQ